MMLRKMLYGGAILIILPVLGLILSLILMGIWNIGLGNLIEGLPRINFIQSFLVIILINLLKIKFDNRKKIEYNEKYK
jgi:hypothetical protein